MSLDILKKDIKSGKPGKLYLFYGPENYLKKYYFDALEKLIVDDRYKDMNSIKLEGNVDPNKLFEAIQTMPFFSERKIIMVKNSAFFKQRNKEDSDKGNKNKGSELENILSNIPEHACVVFYEDEIDKRLKAVNILKKYGVVVEFPYQKAPDLVKWVINIFKSNSKEIDSKAAAYLVDNCEERMNYIKNEVDKLILYAGDKKKVSMEDVVNSCSKSIKSRIFDLTDAMAEGHPDKALKVLDDLVTIKEPIPKILYMMARHFRQVYEASLLKKRGMSVNAIASQMNLNYYAASKILKHTAAFTVKQLESAIEECLEYDVAVKTGKIKDRIAAELLIAKYSGKIGADAAKTY